MRTVKQPVKSSDLSPIDNILSDYKKYKVYTSLAFYVLLVIESVLKLTFHSTVNELNDDTEYCLKLLTMLKLVVAVQNNY